MTKRYKGEIKVSVKDGQVQITIPTDTQIPDKKDFSAYSIYESNGKRLYAITNLAEKNLNDCVKTIQNAGYVAAHKDGSRKNTSIEYAILTYGIEKFNFVKK